MGDERLKGLACREGDGEAVGEVRDTHAALQAVIDDAMAQTRSGKGDERHGNGLDFTDQPIMSISRMVGPGFLTGQAMKKLQEAMSMHLKGDHMAAYREILGVVVYAGAFGVLLNDKLSDSE